MEIEYINHNINELFSDLFDIANSRNLLQKKIGPNLAKKVMIIGIVDYHGDKNEWLIA